MTEYEKELYKNWYDGKFLKKNGDVHIITIVNKIKKDTSNGPFIDSDVAD